MPYDDHFYCEVCDKHSRICWCRSAWREPFEPIDCQEPDHKEGA